MRVELPQLDATELHGLFVRGEASASEILAAHETRICKVEPSVEAFLTLTLDRARKDAAAQDERRSRGEVAGPLAGVPIAIKDVLCVAGSPTTCGSRILDRFMPPFEATCVTKLREAGALILGKTNMDEFAMGSSTEHSAYKKTRNPWDLSRVPGGSSGGSAAAVAAREVPLAVGTDTGGSIRQPAALTGTVGLKPTYGRVSRYGLVAFASSLDQAGPITRTVRDAALALQVMAGADGKDMTSAPVPVPDYVAASRRGGEESDLRGARIGVPAEFFGEGLDPEIRSSLRRCHELLAERGAEIVSVCLPTTEYAIATYYIVATAEASSNLARYDGVRYGFRHADSGGIREMYERTRAAGFGPEVKRRIMLGTYALSAGYYDAYYLKAMKVRSLIQRDFDRAFEKADLLVGPTTPSPAFKFGEKVEDPLAMYLSDIYTVTANLAGVPGLSLPCGFTRDGLPIGCQLLGRRFDESTMFSVAATLESALDLMKDSPPLAVAA